MVIMVVLTVCQIEFLHLEAEPNAITQIMAVPEQLVLTEQQVLHLPVQPVAILDQHAQMMHQREPTIHQHKVLHHHLAVVVVLEVRVVAHRQAVAVVEAVDQLEGVVDNLN